MRSAHLPAALALVLLAGCASLGYYGQAVRGGLGVLIKRQRIDRLLGDRSTPPELRAGLARVVAIRAFAERELALAAGRSYRHYRELRRPHAVWTVVAAPELAVEPVTWCFPIAGCVSYRGYFSRRRAERFATKLARRGHDVDLQGVAAYSTLGRLPDPVLSTFVGDPEADLAALLFHELAHRRLYRKGDTAFNEAFATVVEREGVRRYLESRGDRGALAGYRAAQRREEEVTGLLLAARRRLADLYAAERPVGEKRAGKARILAETRGSFAELAASWEAGETGWERWFDDGLDNARLASVAAYHERIPELEGLLAGCAGDLPCFYEAAERRTLRP